MLLQVNMMTELRSTLELKALKLLKSESKELSRLWALVHTIPIELMGKQSQRCQTSIWELPQADQRLLLKVVTLMLLPASMMMDGNSVKM